MCVCVYKISNVNVKEEHLEGSFAKICYALQYSCWWWW